MEHTKKLKINLITPPDKLDNYNLTFTLVYPTDDTKSQLQNLIENFDKDLNVYMYEQSDSEATINWLLDIVHRSENVVYNILSKNRIYNLDWLYNSIGEQLETTQ